MRHYRNAVAAYKQFEKSTNRIERKGFYQMAKNFIDWHIAEVGGNYLNVYLEMVAEATGYYEKKAAA